MKYPRVTADYPKIVERAKNRAVVAPRAKKIDPKLVKPPPAKPPVFLTCRPKSKRTSSEETDEDAEKVRNVITKNPTDLDIQLSNMKFESPTGSSSSSLEGERVSILRAGPGGQSLKQYCDFDEKRIVRVAPHMRRKDVICDTVDAWSCRNEDKLPNADLSRYKPLIFGGTFPIDAPYRGGQASNPPVESSRSRVSEKRISKTFDIDCPVGYDE